MQSTNPNGIFDRSMVGQTTVPIDFAVERGRVVFYAETIGETDPIHLDPAAAIAAGYPDLVAPATFAVVADFSANDALAKRGGRDLFQMVRCDYRYLLHAEERFDYHGLIYAGDLLQVQGEVLGFEDKKGGELEFARTATRISHAERGPLVTITRTLVHTLRGA